MVGKTDINNVDKPMQKEAKQTKTLGFGAEKVLLSFLLLNKYHVQ